MTNKEKKGQTKNEAPLSMYQDVVYTSPGGDITRINDFRIATDRKISYPNAWFEQNPGKKPSIAVLRISSEHYNQTYGYIVRKFNKGTLVPDEAVAFIWATFAKYPVKIDDDWTSFGLEIGKKGEKVELADLANIEWSDSKFVYEEKDAIEPTEDDLRDLILNLLFIYRYANSSELNDYKDNIRERAEKLIMNTTIFPNLKQNLVKYHNFLGTQAYVSTVAFVDMYFHRFPQHSFSKARIGTVTTRFKDCSVLASTKAIADTLGCTLQKLSVWIWTTGARDDFLRINKADQEIDEDYSYSMYFMELGLSRKSPYSASVNYNLHLFYHAIGCGMGIPRSVHARFVGNPEAGGILQNASVVVYAYNITNDFQFSFMPRAMAGVKSKFTKDLTKVTLENSKIPEKADPIQWVNYIKTQNNCVPELIKSHAVNRWRIIRETRSGTIGEYLLNHAKGSSIELARLEADSDEER